MVVEFNTTLQNQLMRDS